MQNLMLDHLLDGGNMPALVSKVLKVGVLMLTQKNLHSLIGVKNLGDLPLPPPPPP